MNEGLLFQGQNVGRDAVWFAMPFKVLAQIIVDPDPPKRRGTRVASARETRVAALRSQVQRDFKGVKKHNLPSYRRYIDAVCSDERDGFMPEIIAWTEESLTVRADGSSLLVSVPPDCAIVIVDGETQVAGRFDLLDSGRHGTAIVRVLLFHGRRIEFARQVFHDFNTFGKQVAHNTAMLRDQYNDVTHAARELIPAFGRHYSETAPHGVKLTMIVQALNWLTFGSVNEPIKHPIGYEERLEDALRHMQATVPHLEPLLARAQIGPLFVACFDWSVNLASVLAALQSADALPRSGARSGNSAVRFYVAALREYRLPFYDPAAPHTEHASA